MSRRMTVWGRINRILDCYNYDLTAEEALHMIDRVLNGDELVLPIYDGLPDEDDLPELEER